jgi:hypothetical protein
MFDFSGIKPSYDVLVWASEDTNMFWMEFSSAELKISVQKDLREKAFGVIGMPCDEILWIQSPVGMDRRQVMERICTTLELEGFKIERKLIPEHKTSSEVAPIQSFIIG